MSNKEIKSMAVKMPPQNLDAEKSVLGSLMLETKAIDIVIDILRPDEFYTSKHQVIFEAMVDLYQRKEPIDVLSVSNRLKEKNQLDFIGGSAYWGPNW